MIRLAAIVGTLLAAPLAAQVDPPAPLPALGATASGVDLPMPRPAVYKLVWADEFGKPGNPDPSHWRADTSRNRQGWYNDEGILCGQAPRERAR